MIKTFAVLFCTSSLIGLALAPSVGVAAEKVRAGILDCDVSAGFGLIFSEKQTMKCTFKPMEGGPIDHYSGRIKEVGISLGATAGGVMIWNVVSAQKGIERGALAGTYSGLSADDSVGIGLGENVLVGGSNRTFMLQPTSYEGQVGLNVAAGVTTVT